MSELKQSGELFDPALTKTITFDYLEGIGLSPGHVFIKINERQFTLLKAGDFVSHSFIKKYKEKGLQSLFLSEFAEKKHIESFKERWANLKKAATPEDKSVAARNLRKLFYDWYWKKGGVSPHFYTFIIGTFSTFNKIESEELEKIENISTDGFTRSVHVASMAAFVAVILGIDEWEELSDIFHTALLLDVSLLLNDFSYRLQEACELDRKSPDKTQLFIQNKLDEEKRKQFKNHPKTSFEIVKERFSKAFFDINMARVIVYHHENWKGTGFPQEIEFQASADWEVATLIADRLIPYKGDAYAASEGDGFYKGLFNHLKGTNVVKLIPLSRGITIFEQEMERSKKEEINE